LQAAPATLLAAADYAMPATRAGGEVRQASTPAYLRHCMHAILFGASEAWGNMGPGSRCQPGTSLQLSGLTHTCSAKFLLKASTGLSGTWMWMLEK